MDYRTLQNAIQKNLPLVWLDPAPIEGNDYSITQVLLMPDSEPQRDEWEDFILLIHYGEGSEAEVTPDEIDFKTLITDPSCNQTCRQIDENVWEYAEDRTINPETGETERVSETVDLSDYTQEEMFENVQPYGYSFHDMCDWIDSGSPNVMLIAECIFEQSYL
jgi:endogenous inhibitor of DNA gyrase (YacG/DUF329 family)